MAANGPYEQQAHLNSPNLLHKIDELRERNIGQHISLPQLVVVGDQSSGKSSVLQSLTKIPFPRNLELCTRYATQITSRRDNVACVQVSIIPGPHASETHRKHVEEYHRQLESMRDLQSKFPSILEEINTRMGIRTDTQASQGTVFSEDVLKVEVCGPQEDYLTVIDVPGIFRTPTEGVTTKDDVQMVQKMVKRYMQNSRTIILAVLPANVDAATQEILAFAEDYDKAGERTLGVLTKPDLVTERSAQEVVCNLVLGKRKPLKLGYHLMRNRGADEGESFDQVKVEEIFSLPPYNALPKHCVGVDALRTRLSGLLGDITRKEFPKLRKEANKQLDECQKELAALGPARADEQEQRMFLSNIARQFKTVADAALGASYSSNSAFEEKEELRLVTFIVNSTKRFNDVIFNKGHCYHFEKPSQPLQDSNDFEAKITTSQSTTQLQYDEKFICDIDPEQFPILDGIICQTEDIGDPDKGIMDWIDILYLRSRGVDLGVFDGSILSSAFKAQSNKWTPITQNYLSEAILITHRFMTILINTVCSDAGVVDEIWSEIQDEVLKRYELAMQQARMLLRIEREKKPYTLNHYFNDNLQVARNHRKAEELKGKARRSSLTSKHDSFTDGLVVDLNSIINVKTTKSNEQHIKEEIHDILQAYYKVSRKRFVDNIYFQAVDDFLLTGSNSPLSVFSQEWVIMLTRDQLARIAGESSAGRRLRETLVKKMEDLQLALKILKR